MISPKHQAAYNYAQAILHQQSAEDQVAKAFSTLGSDNYIMDLCAPLRHGYRNLVLQTIGDHLFDWLEWWMYDCDHGTKQLLFIVDGTSYDPTQMTLYRFLEIVDASN